MTEQPIGKVTHYFDHIGVAVLALTETLRVGDSIRIHGHTTDLTQEVTSMQIDHAPVSEAKPGQDVALKTAQKVHEHDNVFKVTPE
jgi:translation elongation factor EF-1alpha